jgi:hypothetical protein
MATLAVCCKEAEAVVEKRQARKLKESQILDIISGKSLV